MEFNQKCPDCYYMFIAVGILWSSQSSVVMGCPHDHPQAQSEAVPVPGV